MRPLRQSNQRTADRNMETFQAPGGVVVGNGVGVRVGNRPDGVGVGVGDGVCVGVGVGGSGGQWA